MMAIPWVRRRMYRSYPNDLRPSTLARFLAHMGTVTEYAFPIALAAGVVLGWNFGEGHLHDEQLLRAIQEQCHFGSGELRCIFVESQPFFRPHRDWRIADAGTGEVARGRIAVSALEAGQPWLEAHG